jgi:hypothetical protein
LKKKVLVGLTVVISLVVPFSVFAATSDNKGSKGIRSFFNLDMSKLTDVQKTDIKTYAQKSAELQKEFIKKMIENSSVTKEKGEGMLAKIDERLASGDENGFLQGLGMRGFGNKGQGSINGPRFGGKKEKSKDNANYKSFGKRAMPGRGMKNGLGLKVDTSKLTEAQKADINETYKKMTEQRKLNMSENKNKMAELRKELINKYVSAGAMTKDQGAAQIKKIEEMQQKQ